MRKKKKVGKRILIVAVVLAALYAIGEYVPDDMFSNGLIESSLKPGNMITNSLTESSSESGNMIEKSEIPDYTGTMVIEVNGNIPYFSEDELAAAQTSYERYGDLDALGRCTECIASIGKDIMPTEPRGEIGMIKPSGWKQAKYEGFVDSNPPYLYNRCHLIGFQLTGENANERNLITGTRSFNVDGMEPYENSVAHYIKGTGNHVLYRVTPIFVGNNLVAKGVLMEAKSIEDDGRGILFNVFIYNVQPGIEIDYRTGDSRIAVE